MPHLELVVPLDTNRRENAALGIVAQTFDRREVVSQTVGVSGTVYHTGVYLYAGQLITSLVTYIGAGATTSTMSKLGIYLPSTSATLTLAASTANQSTAWDTTGMKSHTLTSPYTVPADGLYYFSDLSVAATAATLLRQSNVGIGGFGGISGLPADYCTQTGQTDLPASSSTSGASAFAHWIAAI